MYEFGYKGHWEKIPVVAEAIYNHDKHKIEQYLLRGLDLNLPIQFSDYTKLTPLEISVLKNDIDMVHFLLDCGADPHLPKQTPLILTASRCASPDMVSLFAWQIKKLDLSQKRRLICNTRYGNRPENIPVLEQNGITVAKYGGDAFRSAVSDGDFEFAQLLLDKGADINYHKPDMVFPYAATPVSVAVSNNDFPMVRWLIENGADITISDKYGDRPYTIAKKNQNTEMADYLKALEPEEWHNEQEKALMLKSYKLPDKLVNYIKSGPLRLEFAGQEYAQWAKLHSFMDLQEISYKRKKLLSIMAEMDKYGDGYLILWNPKDKKLWYLDTEHDEFHPVATWDDFISQPGYYLNKIINGDYLKC